MAINTYKTYLLSSDSENGTYAKVCTIKDYPDLGGDPNQLDSTDLECAGYTYIKGIEQTPNTFEFTANYDKSAFQTISGTTGKKWYKVAFNSATSGTPAVTTYGQDGYWKFEGEISVKVSGKGVDEVREMVIQIVPNSVPVFGITT